MITPKGVPKVSGLQRFLDWAGVRAKRRESFGDETVRLILVALIALLLGARSLPAQDADATKAKAYELYQAKHFDEAARQFKAYLDITPNDIAAAIDYASLLSEIQRHEEATKLLESVHQKVPQNEAAYFNLGVEYAALKRYADAGRIFSEVQKSNNPALASAAATAATRAREDQKREERLKAEQHVYDLARQFKFEEVVNAVNDLEKQGDLGFGMQMQRLYALQSLRQYAVALERADKLAVAYADEPDLALLRAELFVQLGRRGEAEMVWRELKSKHPGTPAALEADRRLNAALGHPANPEEEHVYELARQRKHRDVIAAINGLEQKGPLSLNMQMQRLYSMQALGQNKEAIAQLDKIASLHSNSTEIAFIRSDLLVQQHRWTEASAILKQLKDESGDTKVALEAERRLSAIPTIANLDKNFWGEAYVAGDYLGRFGTVVGSGFARQGAFIPRARWLQPYAEMRFGVDTSSGTSGNRTIITDNHVGFYGGIRAQPLQAEYLFVYAQGGTDIDLLDRRHHGDWSLDYQAGIYGFKSIGPGKILFRAPPGSAPSPLNGERAGVRGETVPEGATLTETETGPSFFWRGDWFDDAGADFSYYHRYASWIGYGQAHEGVRLAQYGPNVAFDAYVVENLSWDVRGNYFDNLIEIGPGARALWLPYKGWEVVLRAEWLNGFYIGRGRAAAPKAESQYDELHVALSVGVRW